MSKKKRKEAEAERGDVRQTEYNKRIYNRPHNLTPQIRKFCYLWASNFEKMTLEEFGEKFGVSISTITRWISWPIVKKEVNRLLESTDNLVMSFLETHQEEILKNLYKLFKDKKVNPEIKRKIGNNLLGYSRLVDVNVGRQVVIQQTAVSQGQVNFDDMSDDELRAELEELRELREA